METIGKSMLHGEIGLKVLRMSRQDNMSLHNHDFMELVIVLRGKGLHITESERHKIMAGDVFFIKSDDAHGYQRVDKLELVNLIFTSQLLSSPQIDLKQLPGYHALFKLEPEFRRSHGLKRHLRLSMSKLRECEKLILSIEKEQERKIPGGGTMCFGIFLQLITLLSREYSEQTKSCLSGVMKFGDILGYMERHYTEPIALDKLATRASLSKGAFIRSFKKHFGKTPLEYLIDIRLRKAADLLRTTNHSIGEIAEEVGFNDSNYFSRQFKKTLNVSPREWRNLSE